MSIEIHGIYMHRNIEISVNFERGPYINAHAQNIAKASTECACLTYFLAEVKNS